MRIAVFGTGGVGGYFGGRLAREGEEVVFIARGAHLEAIRARGLQVDSVQGDFVIHPALAEADPAQVGIVDVILVGVKAWQVPAAAKAMKPLVGESTFVVPLQNGVDAASQLAVELGDGHVLGGLCQISAMVAGPGHVRHVGIEPLIAFGELDNRPSERAERLKEAFSRAGVRAEIPADIQVAMWDKFLFIAAISGVGAITRAPADVTRSLAETRRMLAGVMREIVAVANARQVHLKDEAVARRMAFIDQMPSGVIPSMQRDLLEGRPSELDSLVGAVARLGLEAGVPVPLSTFIYHSLLPQELRARKELEF
jgi:2-dehydropantoate 2-reductase